MFENHINRMLELQRYSEFVDQLADTQVVEDIEDDGNSLFEAISYVILEKLNKNISANEIRLKLVEYIRNNPNKYPDYTEEDLHDIATDNIDIDPQDIELLDALAHALNLDIILHHENGVTTEIRTDTYTIDATDIGFINEHYVAIWEEIDEDTDDEFDYRFGKNDGYDDPYLDLFEPHPIPDLPLPDIAMFVAALIGLNNLFYPDDNCG